MIVGIPAGNFSSNHACRVARRMNQARNRTAGNTLLMRIASNLYMKMAASGCPYYEIFADSNFCDFCDFSSDPEK